MSIKPGISVIETVESFGGITSKTLNPPTNVEYGRRTDTSKFALGPDVITDGDSLPGS